MTLPWRCGRGCALSIPLQSNENDFPSVAEHDPIIEIQDLHFARSGRPIFAGLSLTVRRGMVTALMGPSGTGKTTLLKLVGGQLSRIGAPFWWMARMCTS